MLGVSPVLALRTVDFPQPLPPLSTGTGWSSPSAVSWTKPRSCSGTHGDRGLVVDDAADDEPFAEGVQVAVDGADGRVGVDAALPPRSSSPWRSVQNQSSAAASASPPRGLSAWSGVSLPPAGEHRPRRRVPRWRRNAVADALVTNPPRRTQRGQAPSWRSKTCSTTSGARKVGVTERTPGLGYALFRAGTKRISTRLFRAAAIRRSIANECPS